MALRFLLVGLVIGLGVELPSGDEISCWARAGSDWLQARIDGAFGPEAVAESKSTPDGEFAAIVDQMAASFAAPKSTPDAEFAAIVDRMAGSFSTDLTLADRAATPRQLTFEPIEVPEDSEPGAAVALDGASQGAGQTPDPDATEVAKPPAPEPAPAGRLASAVRLTREAAAAWMTVIRGAEATVRVR